MLTFERMRYVNNKVVHDTQCNIIAAQSSSEYLMLPKQKHVIRAAVLSKITQIYYIVYRTKADKQISYCK